MNTEQLKTKEEILEMFLRQHNVLLPNEKLEEVDNYALSAMYKAMQDFAQQEIQRDRESRWITDRLPEPKKGWNHSDRVLLWYEGTENHEESYGIGYYHYDPPFDDPKWIDFHYAKSRQPSGWQPLPEPPKL